MLGCIYVDAINASDGEIEEIDRDLEEFKSFCLMTKPLHGESSQGCCESQPEGPACSEQTLHVIS